MELRERVADAIGSADRLAPTDREVWVEQADAALVALGLDDLNAAVERGAQHANEQYFAAGPYGVPWHRLDPEERDNFCKVARLTLEAALTPPEATDGSH